MRGLGGGEQRVSALYPLETYSRVRANADGSHPAGQVPHNHPHELFYDGRSW